MQTMAISAEVQLQEAKAMIAHLEQRNLFLAQSLRQSFQIGFDYEKKIAELTAQSKPDGTAECAVGEVNGEAV